MAFSWEKGRMILDLLLSNLWLFIKGIAIGFAVAAPVGPIGMLCIRTTLERGRIAGLSAGLGAALADTIFAAVAAFSISAVSDYLLDHRKGLEWGAGFLMIALGGKLLWHPPKIRPYEKPVPAGLWAEFITTFILTLANPVTILSFLGIFAGFAGIAHISLASIPILLIAIFIGACGWWIALAEGVGMIRHRISQNGLEWMNRVAGLLLAGFGLITLYQLLR